MYTAYNVIKNPYTMSQRFAGDLSAIHKQYNGGVICDLSAAAWVLLSCHYYRCYYRYHYHYHYCYDLSLPYIYKLLVIGILGIREFKDVVFEDVVFDNNIFGIHVTLKKTIHNRFTQLLLSNTTSSNTTSLNSRGIKMSPQCPDIRDGPRVFEGKTSRDHTEPPHPHLQTCNRSNCL